MERIGWISNFDKAARGVIGEQHSGIEFVDSEIYKLLEAMAWELGRKPDESLEARYCALVARVAAAQDSDGYLHTSFGHSGQPERYSNLEWGHELYCFGHLIQAAVARIRSGHPEDKIVDVARRLADHVYVEFGPTGRPAICGHPEIETALAELARATGETHYLEMARLFVERRGHGTLSTTILFGHEYFQDDVPVREASILRGHAVRALYLASGALDVATETSDRELGDAIALQWSNTVSRRTYITGGMGSHHQDEAFGDDYELPADRAYSETCAGIGSVMLSWRLLLETGEDKYANLIERTLLNNILASPREDGRAFYYTNTLQQRTEGTEPSEEELSERAEASLRAPWFEVSCCPTNVARTLASVGLYFATADDQGVQLHQYGDYTVRTSLPDGRDVALRVRSGYPFEGEVEVTVLEEADITLTMRVPDWAKDEGTIQLHCGGDVSAATVVGSEDAAIISRSFSAGDKVVLRLPVRPRIVRPHPRIDGVRGTVAIERGPLVLALESTDLPAAVSTESVELVDDDVQSTAEGALAKFRIRQDSDDAPWPYWAHRLIVPTESPMEVEAELRPYFAWANRGPSTMRVWLPIIAGETVPAKEVIFDSRNKLV